MLFTHEEQELRLRVRQMRWEADGATSVTLERLDGGLGPRNNFALHDSPHYLFIAGGIGITPLLPMIEAADAAGARWQLTYGGRSPASMAFRDERASHRERVQLLPQDERGLLDLAAVLGTPQPDTLVYDRLVLDL